MWLTDIWSHLPLATSPTAGLELSPTPSLPLSRDSQEYSVSASNFTHTILALEIFRKLSTMHRRLRASAEKCFSLCSMIGTVEFKALFQFLTTRTILAETGGSHWNIIISADIDESTTSFYVRSVPQPDTYWYFDPSTKVVVASRTQRSRFTITIAANKPPGTVIIGGDDILITVNGGTNVGLTTSQNSLSKSDHTFPFKFSSFYNDFQIDSTIIPKLTGSASDVQPGTTPSASTQSITGAIVRNPNNGERWELV